jgi:chromosome segregation ATPase
MEELTKAEPRGSKALGAIAVTCAALGVVLATGGYAWKQQRDQLRVEKVQLTGEKQQLSDKLQSLESQSAEANATLDEVQKGLEEIRAKELKVIQSSIQVAQEGQGKSAGRERLQVELQMIRDAVHRNLEKLARLEKTNKANGVRVASLEKLADELKRSLEEKAATVTELEGRVGDLSKTVESQATTLAEREETIHKGETEIAQKTKELNTAYVAVASKNVLKQKGVVERKGAVAGLGGRWIETGKFDPEVFHEIDVTKDMEVEIPAPKGKVQVVTAQPKESYEIVDGGPNSKSSKLAVKDPSAFWKGDRYLVVMIPD